MIEGHRDNKKLFEIMKEYFPGFQNARIREISDVNRNKRNQTHSRLIYNIYKGCSGRKNI